jgi:hypothetical protein
MLKNINKEGKKMEEESIEIKRISFEEASEIATKFEGWGNDVMEWHLIDWHGSMYLKISSIGHFGVKIPQLDGYHIYSITHVKNGWSFKPHKWIYTVHIAKDG